MNILLLRPTPPEETIGLQHLMTVEPLELEVLAASLSVQHTITIVDMILEKKPVEAFIKVHHPDILCVTGYITHMGVMSDYCRVAKIENSAIVTVVGGVHLEKNPDDGNHPWVDFRVIRNATRTFPALVEAIADAREVHIPGILRPGEQSCALPPLDFYFPHPRRDLVKRYAHRYFYVFHSNVATVKTSFGCPSSCSFCYCREITDRKYHARELDDVLSELEKIPQREIFIVDDNFLVSAERVEKFITGLNLRKIKKHFLVFGRAEFIAQHPDIIKHFKHAGLRTVIVGFESFSDDELTSMRKKTSACENEHALATLARLGLDCYAAIILSPDWDHNDFSVLRRKTRQLGIVFANFQPLTPLPGTDISYPPERLLVKRDSFAEWDLAHIVIKPSKMKVSDYYREIIRLYTSSVIRPAAILRHLGRPLPMLLKSAYGLYTVWRQYRNKIRLAVLDEK
jgi:radical SAM superfamily enzyme YgiQ (UPF0313 family)